MTERPRLSDAKRAEQAARAERLARALRDNLRRRKQQTRERADMGAPLPAQRRPRADEPPA